MEYVLYRALVDHVYMCTFLSLSISLSLSLHPLPLLLITGAGTFGAVRAGIYRPRAGGGEVKCAVKCLKQSSEDPVPNV